jgi:hypothetical protein
MNDEWEMMNESRSQESESQKKRKSLVSIDVVSASSFWLLDSDF